MNNKMFVAQLDYCWMRLHQVNYSAGCDLFLFERRHSSEQAAGTGNCHVLHTGGQSSNGNVFGIYQEFCGSSTKFLFRNFHIWNLQMEGDHNKLIFPKNVCYYSNETQNKTRKYGQLRHT
jgi:hypothetical protein